MTYTILKFRKNYEYLNSYLIKNNTDDYQYDIDKMYEDLDKINFIKSGNSILIYTTWDTI